MSLMTSSTVSIQQEETRQCIICDVVKPISSFWLSGNGHRRWECPECKKDPSKWPSQDVLRKKRKECGVKRLFSRYGKGDIVTLSAVRECDICDVEKPVSDFSILGKNEKTGRVYFRRECRECRKAVMRRGDQEAKSKKRREAWKRRQPEKNWESQARYRLKKEYGLTPEEAQRILTLQNGFCANRACGKQIMFGTRKMGTCAVIDHCHVTGKVRGVLCDPCNKTIGLGRENANILFGAAEYIVKFEQTLEKP